MFVSLLVAEFCTLAVEKENSLKEIFLNFIALTFIVQLDDMMIQCPLFRPFRQYVLIRKGSGATDRERIDLEGDLNIELSWSSARFAPEEAPSAARWLFGKNVYRFLGYGKVQAHDAPISTFNPELQLPVTAGYRKQRLLLIALVSLVHNTLLFSFSHFGRLDKALDSSLEGTEHGKLEPHDLLGLVQLLSHTFMGFAMGVLYVERIGVASGVGWLVTQLVLLALAQQCIEWGLTMGEMLLPAAPGTAQTST